MPDDRDECTSFFYVDKDGKKSDAGLFDDDEPADPYGYAKGSIDRALKRGMSLEDAFRSYGPQGVTLEQYQAEMKRRADAGLR